MVKPNQNFDLRRGKFGLGAIELAGRFNQLNFGDQVFTGGLADPNLWTNQLYTIDLGVNWYWTQYIKVSIGWEHAGFGNPVTYARPVAHEQQRGDLADAALLLTRRAWASESVSTGFVLRFRSSRRDRPCHVPKVPARAGIMS